MGLRLRLRALIYPCILTIVSALAVLTLIFGLTGGEVPAGLVNSGILGRIAGRYGVQYSVRSLRIGSFLNDCRSPIDAAGVQLTFRDLGPVFLQIDSVHWCWTEPLAIQGVKLGGPSQPDLVALEDAEVQLSAGAASIRNLSLSVGNVRPGTELAVGGIEFSTATGNAVARNIRISTGSESLANIQQVQMSLPAFSKETGLLNLASIDAAGVDVRLADTSPAVPICERTDTILSTSSDLAAMAQRSIETLNQTQFQLRRDLRYAPFIALAVLFILKVWVTAWTRQRNGRGAPLLLGAVAVSTPVLLHWVGRSLPLLQLTVLSLALSLTLAMILRFRIYRYAAQWYQRWEPFTVDVACFALVLPFAAASLDFGTPLRSPTAFEIGRLNVADISLTGSQNQCDVRQVIAVTASSAAVEQVHLDLPDTSQETSNVRIGRIDLPGISARVHDERTPDLDLVTVSDASVSADQLMVNIDWRSRTILDLGAHARLRGVVSASAFTRPFGPPSPNGGGLDFAIDLSAVGAGTEPAVTEDLYQFDDPATVSLRGAIAFDPESCDLKYAWAARMLTAPIRLVGAGLGDSGAVAIRSIRTLPGSLFQITDGAGRISFARDIPSSFRLSGLRAPAGASHIQIDSTEFSGSARSSCFEIHQNLTAGINGVHIENGSGWNARIARTDIAFSRSATSGANPASLVAAIRDTRFMDGSGTADAGQISGSIPLLELELNGSTPGSGAIPRRFDGGLAFSLSTATDVVLRNDTPLKILADLREGAIAVPDQQQVLFQSIVSQLPRNLPLWISLDGGLRSAGLAARVRVPQLPMDLGPLQTEIRDLEIEANTGTATVAYQTGWNRVRLPKLASIFCLEDIARFDLSLEGEAARFVLPQTMNWEFQNQPGRCAEAPPFATERSFKVQGAWPSIRLEGESGSGIRILNIAETQLQKADLTDARLRSLELESTLSGIQTLGGDGALSFRTHVTISNGDAKLTSSILGANGAPLADMALNGLPSQPDIEVFPRAGTEELVNALAPFLPGAGLSLRGITPRARIDRVHARLEFEGSALSGLSAEVEVGTGPLVTIDSPESATLRNLDLSIVDDPTNPSRNGVRLNLDKDAVEVQADLSRLSMRAIDARGAEIQTTAALHTTIRGTLSERRPPPDEILAKLSATFGGIKRHFDKALQVFGNPAASVPQPMDLNWKLGIHNSRADESLLQLAGETVRVRMAGDVEKFAWRTGQGAPSTVAAAGEFAGDLTIHDDQLVLDAHLPVRLDASLGTAPSRKVELDLPLLVLFSDALRPAGDASASLWDSEYYRSFWNTYRVREAARGAAAVIDTARFVAGPMSLRQISVPIEPLRIALGRGDRLEMHVPFSGRTLFGSAGGLFQTAVTWRGDQASFDSRFNLALRNIQAGAVGLAEYGHTPFVEDELDGDIMVRTDDWRVDRNTLDRTAGLPSPGLDALSLTLELRKSERSQSIPGMLQLSSDTQVTTLNNILNAILRDLPLVNPPQKMSYRNLKLAFRMDKGKVATEAPWLTIDGLRLFSSAALDVEGNIRMHGGRYGEPLELRHLLDAIIPK